jgi:hypothetical protein
LIAKYGSFEYALADRYRFEAELGRGAMGAVYRARDLRLDRVVAIKMLHATLTNDLGILRFQSEIRIAASLHHPSIVAIHDSGEADGRLFYVMEHLDGETLRARLNREKQLSVDDALAITEQIAEALQFAHDRGVVHRDIKPENILLSDGRARVVDFGLARALGDIDAERLTASGLSVGTPQYLSPEQAAAEKEVGPRADQYGMACVLYEMLAGEPPFTGPTATAVAMRHISEIPALLRNRRRTTPPAVEASVMRALEKVPADRFGTMRDFVAALRGTGPVVTSTSTGVGPSMGAAGLPRRKRLALPYVLALGVLTVVVIGMIGAAVVRLDDSAGGVFGWWTSRSLDTTRYAVLPFASTVPGVSAPLDDKIRDALGRWEGISVAGRPEMQAATRPGGAPAVSANDGRALARAVGAGRYVMGEVTAGGGSMRVRAEALDATGRTTGKSASVLVSNGALTDSVVSHLVYQLLYSGDEAKRDEGDARGTGSRAAFQWYLAGREAMRVWSLTAADSALATALRLDGSFPQASLALAEVRTWMSDAAPSADGLITRAWNRATLLSLDERSRVAALEDLRAARFPSACARYDSLTSRDSLDFAAWYGVGQCNRGDVAVVRDASSPSGLRFRGSYYRAQLAFNRAFALLPSIDSCCEARADDIMRHALLLKSPSVRYGHGIRPDSSTYGAYPELLADTIAFVPRPVSALNGPPPSSFTDALREQRQQFYSIARRRAARTYGPAALEELAEAMELLNLPATVDTIRRALSLTSDSSTRLRLPTYDIWLRTMTAIPDAPSELRSLRVLAESLVVHSRPETSSEYELLAGIANLIGDADRAAALSQHVDRSPGDSLIPPAVMGAYRGYLAYAAAGGPVDSLREFERRVAAGIANDAPSARQSMLRSMLLGQPGILAFPAYRSSEFEVIPATTRVMEAERAFAAHDYVRARKLLSDAANARAGAPPANISLDALYPQAWLLAAVGDSSRALKTLTPTLDALRFIPASSLSSAVMAGALLQTMSLRARLTVAARDTADARRWYCAVDALTSSPGGNGRRSRQRVITPPC